MLRYIVKNIVIYRDFFNRQIQASILPTKYCKFCIFYSKPVIFLQLGNCIFLHKNCKTNKIQLLETYLQYTVNLTVINCKKFRFNKRFTVDFTVGLVGGQIGCPYFTVIFFTVYLRPTYFSCQRIKMACSLSFQTLCQRLKQVILGIPSGECTQYFMWSPLSKCNSRSCNR